ncbi:MAG: helix-turn-helix domain-containing protein [Candidatus Daviesbacteria bacterium]|nr:helix-turn-helix domain-containing protein [Candidatus Daviesbacteria bacterium]
MSTVGETLKEARESRFYTLDEVEKATKIRKELLVALEEDDYSKLPPPTFVQGFIKNYARFLNLNSHNLLAIFRREFSDKKYQPYIMDAFSNPIPGNRFQITPGRVIGSVVSAIILIFFAYLWLQYRQFSGAPTLQVKSPPDQFTSEIANITVEGQTTPETTVLVNNQQIPVDPTGIFKEVITLSSPVNKITISATSKLGHKTEVERIVYLKR